MFINQELGEINLKLVYYGPSLGGKTTNLKYIHARTPKHLRSQLVSLKTHHERTLFFDFMQLELGTINGLRPRFKLFSMAGQVCYAASRRLLLQGTDGIIFVADSDCDRLIDNLESWYTMDRHLAELGEDMQQFPIVIQLNKRDSPNAAAVEEMLRNLGAEQRPWFEAVAASGVGVFETLKAAMQIVIAQVVRCNA